MSLPDQTPKLPKLPFLLVNAVLLGAAWYLATRDPGPLSVHTIAAVTACVALAAILVVVPFLTDYARFYDNALDERQRGLDALSRTITTAAEQISIAANGLNELTDLTHKNIKHAEQLPHKLQDKIAEFNAQLDNARQDDREELEKEIAELRTSETDRLQSVSDKIHKTIGELTRLEATFQQHASGRTEQLDRAQLEFSKTQAAAAAALRATFTSLTQELASAHTRAVAEIDRKLNERVALAASALENAFTKTPVAAAQPVGSSPAINAGPQSSVENAGASETSPDVASPPKRPRKARREESLSTDAAASSSVSPATPTKPASSPEVGAMDATHSPPPFLEPAPIPAAAIVQIEPVAPASAQPFPVSEMPHESIHADGEVWKSEAGNGANDSPASSATSAPDSAERAARKRPGRKPATEPTSELSLEFAGDAVSGSEESVTSGERVEAAVSSDGATRLIAVAYIGIGNRLFIRGEGPGLSWEKGIPLQFVSIGKWRWETAEATAPIRFKLYKNDELECPGLGSLVLEPGHQQEVTAKF